MTRITYYQQKRHLGVLRRGYTRRFRRRVSFRQHPIGALYLLN